jgi:hypothetical protein
MKRNWKCKVGLHDWEQISCMTSDDVANYAKNQVYGNSPTMVSSGRIDAFAEKVCIRCGLYKDEITPAKRSAIRLETARQIRRAKAERIMNEKPDLPL